MPFLGTWQVSCLPLHLPPTVWRLTNNVDLERTERQVRVYQQQNQEQINAKTMRKVGAHRTCAGIHPEPRRGLRHLAAARWSTATMEHVQHSAWFRVVELAPYQSPQLT